MLTYLPVNDTTVDVHNPETQEQVAVIKCHIEGDVAKVVVEQLHSQFRCPASAAVTKVPSESYGKNKDSILFGILKQFVELSNQQDPNSDDIVEIVSANEMPVARILYKGQCEKEGELGLAFETEVLDERYKFGTDKDGVNEFLMLSPFTPDTDEDWVGLLKTCLSHITRALVLDGVVIGPLLPRGYNNDFDGDTLASVKVDHEPDGDFDGDEYPVV